jgi:hypothetical protein
MHSMYNAGAPDSRMGVHISEQQGAEPIPPCPWILHVRTRAWVGKRKAMGEIYAFDGSSRGEFCNTRAFLLACLLGQKKKRKNEEQHGPGVSVGVKCTVYVLYIHGWVRQEDQISRFLLFFFAFSRRTELHLRCPESGTRKGFSTF